MSDRIFQTKSPGKGELGCAQNEEAIERALEAAVIPLNFKQLCTGAQTRLFTMRFCWVFLVLYPDFQYCLPRCWLEEGKQLSLKPSLREAMLDKVTLASYSTTFLKPVPRTQNLKKKKKGIVRLISKGKTTEISLSCPSDRITNWLFHLPMSLWK